MAKKLFVGGLSYNTADEALKEAFSKAGVVESATVIVDKTTNRSKGFGFVEMSSEEEAQEAIKMFNGKEIDGRSVTVSEARPLEDRPRRDGFRRDSRGGGNRHGGNRDRRGGFGNRRNDNW